LVPFFGPPCTVTTVRKELIYSLISFHNFQCNLQTLSAKEISFKYIANVSTLIGWLCKKAMTSRHWHLRYVTSHNVRRLTSCDVTRMRVDWLT